MRPLHWYDYISINSYWLGLSSISQTLSPLLLPLLVQHFVGESQKGSYFGSLRLWTLMVAILVQALMGMVSDRSNSHIGRRRPFILIGTIGVLIVLTLIGLSTRFEGVRGYWILFILMIFLMISVNTAHSAQQALIPDLVPIEKRGFASGIKALLEVPIPAILVSLTIAPLFSHGKYWEGLIVLMAILVISMGVAMFVHETPQKEKHKSLDWPPFIRLFAMTAVFCIVILGVGQLTRILLPVVVSLSSRVNPLLTLTIFGSMAMGVAIFLGVWLSVRIGLSGDERSVPGFSWWVINRLAFLVGSTNLLTFVLYFLQERFHLIGNLAAGPAATLIQVVGILILLSAVPGGWLSDRIGKMNMVFISGILAIVGTFFVIIASNLILVYSGGILLGIGVAQFYSSNWALGTEMVPPHQAGKFLGISNLAGAGAGAIGAYIGGPIADWFSTSMGTHSSGYLVLFIIFDTMFLLSITALIPIREKMTGKPGRRFAFFRL
jgi:MFS family permease